MCLAVPGMVVEVAGQDDPGVRLAKIDFQGNRVSASLIFTPEAEVGDWVLVHAGFAIRRLSQQEACETWNYLRPEDVEDLEVASDRDSAAAGREAAGGAA